jgi:hypothetical protein
MTYQARKFDRGDYDKYDDVAKRIFIDHLVSKGYKIISDDETFMHDIVAERDNKIVYFEVEVKVGYPFTSQEDFPFPTVSFTGRKIRLHKKKPFFYVIIDIKSSTMVYCHSSLIYHESHAQELSIDKRGRKGFDKFYRVPKEICTFARL